MSLFFFFFFGVCILDLYLVIFVQGEGTRDGSGKCSCNSGYQGEKCLECKDGFYEESSNDTHTECKGRIIMLR